ncbi:MAG: CvpA family protein [Paracoccaceae bacterium]|nr:CvpA family protein [Paracoccaceae bacterium]
MELFNEIDILSFIIVFISILLSYFRGFLRECYTVLAWALSAILSLNLGPSLIPIIQEIPFLDEFFLGNCPLTMLISFVLSFVISLTIFSLLITFFNPRTSLYGEVSIFGNLNNMSGIIFGFSRSIIILIFLLICVQDLLPRSFFSTSIIEKVNNSLSSQLLMPSKIFIKEKISNNASDWLSKTYELILKNECQEYT